YFLGFVWIACVAWLGFHGTPRLTRVTLVGVVIGVGVLLFPWYAGLPASLAAWRVTGDWLNTPLTPGQLVYGVFRFAGSTVNGVGVWGGKPLTIPLQAVLFAMLAVAVVRRGVRPLATPAVQLLLLWLAAAAIGPVVLDGIRHTAMSRIERYA